MTRRLEGVIFDLDGTLIDSEELYYQGDRAFLQSFGQKYTREMHSQYVGIGSLSFVNIVKEQFQLPESTEELLKIKDHYYLLAAQNQIKVFPEMIKLVKALFLQKMPLALASGSSGHIITKVLEETGLTKYFNPVVSSEEVPQGKPAPDVFLEVARRWKTKASRLAVVEDSVHGIQAAQAAGMISLAVPYIQDKSHKEVFEQADFYHPEGAQSFRAEFILEYFDEHFCRCEDCQLYQEGRCVDED